MTYLPSAAQYPNINPNLTSTPPPTAPARLRPPSQSKPGLLIHESTAGWSQDRRDPARIPTVCPVAGDAVQSRIALLARG